MAEVTVKDNAVGWLINFGIMMTYFRKIYVLSNKSKDRQKNETPTPAGKAYTELVNILNSALAIKGYSPYGITVISQPTNFNEFLEDWYLLRAQLPGAVAGVGKEPILVAQAMDLFYTKWIAPKIPTN